MKLNPTAVVFWLACALCGFAIFGTLQALAGGLATGLFLSFVVS